MPEGNPFQDDKPIPDPNTPPPGRETYYKPYWKKNGATAAVPRTPVKESPRPTPATVPVKRDPYAVAPPVHIKGRPIQSAGKVALRQAEPTREFPTVKVAATEEIEPVSINISDEPPTPPMVLPAAATKRIELSVPVNPLR